MKRILLLIPLVAAALLFAGAADAQSLRNSAKGEATLGSKNVSERTIEIGDYVFKVTRETLIKDRDGNLMRLADVPVPEMGEEGEGDWEVIGARFRAKRIGDDNVLMFMQLIDAPH